MVNCRAKLSWDQLWSVASMLNSMCFVLLASSPRSAYMVDLAGSIGADVCITDPTAPTHIEHSWDDVWLDGTRDKCVLKGTMVS